MNQQELIPHLFRTEFSKISSVLSRLFGVEYIGVAEDITSEVFLLALETWPYRGAPENPAGWLMQVARNRALDRLRETLARLENTLGTLGRMERRSGHILNWYDTTTLQPLEPQYVSTVDSGNLAGYLWALREACAQAARCSCVTGLPGSCS